LLALVAMTTADFAAFFELAAESHARDNVSNGRWSPTDAPALARQESKKLLPEGERTAGNYLFVLRDLDANVEVGYLWYGTVARGAKKVAFLYQIYIHAQFRRKGFGRQAMHAFEKAALGTDHDELALNVSAANEAARRLYEAIGYSESSIVMRKAASQ
jgi:ribosomal protein S18 acetylase RimI-like enzyme